MSLHLDRHPSFAGRPGPLLLVIADGVGVAPDGPSNAVSLAATPTLDGLTSGELYTELAAHGPAVGLPTDDDMGNSEVGHNALGAGRVFAQGAKLVNRAIESGALFEGPVWKQAIEHARNGTMHFIGLHSDGNVHSNNEHLYAMLRRAADEGVTSAAVHILHDGRDVPSQSALVYIALTEQVLSEINAGGPGRNFRIASGGGRMYITMDRYEADWPMVERGYRAHTWGEGRRFASATDAVETMYDESKAAGKEPSDQYLHEFVVVDEDGPVGTMADGDAVIVYNFRGDRAIEISRAFDLDDLDSFDRGRRPDVYYAGMMEYDGDTHVPRNFLVEPPDIERTMGEYLVKNGVTQLAMSETQKFGHVTYFWNGNNSGKFDESMETYLEITSDRVPFDQRPWMKAAEITDRLMAELQSGRHRFARVNYANGDMVGHTGSLDATIIAVEALDLQLARLRKVVAATGGLLVVTADHGNADEMFQHKKGKLVRGEDGAPVVKTSHTLNPVPFLIWDSTGRPPFILDPARAEGAGIANVAATCLELLGFVPPDDMNKSLLGY